MDKFRAMQTFVRIVEGGSLTRAAASLETSLPTVVRTLAALEELPPGGTLVQLNVRVPQFLLPRLEERGFTYEIREQAPDLVRVFIRRGPDAHTNAEEPS